MSARAAPCIALALNADGSAPEWVELLPAGPLIAGRDGRRWIVDDVQAVLDASQPAGAPFPIDWEHSTDLRAPNGQEAPAAGWVDRLELRDGAIWGRVEWTPRAAAQIASREYRYLSPVFAYDPDTLVIVRLLRAGLTNHPNLDLTALNHHQEASPMALAAILAALGLPETATAEQAVTAINTLHTERQTALNRAAAAPALDQYVPRADYDVAINRATSAERRLAEHAAGALEDEIAREIDAALAAGKITPATRDYHLAQCRQTGGLERFRAFVAAAPAVGDPVPGAGTKPPHQATALNAAELEACRVLGMSEADYRKAKTGA